jgi:hypothetical protein
MSGRKMFVAVSAVAVCAMTVAAHPAEAPLLDRTDSAYAPAHRVVPAPIMGIRGETLLLSRPANA